MALISVDEPPAPGTKPTFAEEISLVIPALDDLMGEELFPVFQGDGVVDPNIVALDSAGGAVAVDLVEELDSQALVRSLSHAGAVGRMSRGELAARYPSGLEGFQHELAGYLGAMPYRRPKPSGEGGRLVIICSHAQPEVWNAIAFLNRPDGPVKVLRANSLQAIDGQTFVDVSPYVVPKDATANSAPHKKRGLFAAITHRRNGGEAATTSATPASQARPAVTRAELRRQRAAANHGSLPSIPGIGDRGVSHSVAPVARAARKNSVEPNQPAQPTGANQPVEPKRAVESSGSAAVSRPVEPNRPVVAPAGAGRPLANQNPARPSRKRLRELGELGIQATPLPNAAPTRQTVRQRAEQLAAAKVEFAGVFARGTEATDHLSWDTASFPVVARPKRNPLAD